MIYCQVWWDFSNVGGKADRGRGQHCYSSRYSNSLPIHFDTKKEVWPSQEDLANRISLCLSRFIWRLTPDSRAYVGLYWPYVAPCWAILGAMLGPCLGHLCWEDLKMPIFPLLAPSWSPKPRKNRGFVTSPRWNPLPPKGPKHRKKKQCFWTSQAKYTVY